MKLIKIIAIVMLSCSSVTFAEETPFSGKSLSERQKAFEEKKQALKEEMSAIKDSSERDKIEAYRAPTLEH